MNPFDYVNAITYSKEKLPIGKDYNSFIVNRSLSYFIDCVLPANEINMNSHLDKKLQFDFLINSIRKSKRFSKWHKRIDNADLEIVKTYYSYSNDKAEQALKLLSKEQLKTLKNSMDTGG